jgi:cystathionine gamma-synthase
MSGQLSVDTLAVRGGYHPQLGDGISPDINLSSTYYLPGDGGGGIVAYGRSGVPAFAVFEQAVADVEQAAHAMVFNSGTSAMAALVGEVGPGQRIVFSHEVYYGFLEYADESLRPHGVIVEHVDLSDLDAAARAIPGAAMVWVETPTNPHLTVTDLAGIARICADAGVPWVCDNTFATPVLTRPIELGALASMESVTKYLGGHSDLILGSVATNDSGLWERMEKRRARIGTQPDGFTCWLARRGMQTLGVRVHRQSATALEVARRLEAHPKVSRVYYPGLPSHSGHEVAARQMCGGFGGMLSFVVQGGKPAANLLTESTRLWVPATSLGSVESLIERRSRWDGDDRVDPALLRLSAGIENVEDLWADLERTLAQI